MTEERDNYVYIVEADAEAVARAVRRLQILVLAFIPVLLVGVGFAWVLRFLTGDPPEISSSVPALLILLAIPVVAVYLVVPRSIKKTDVWIGGDFIHAPLVVAPRYTATVRYKDMTVVMIDVVKGRIAGARIGAKGVAVCTGRIRDPGIVVRAIFEHAPENTKWRQGRWPHRKLSREQIQELIERTEVPDINRLLPRSAHYACDNELFARSQPQSPSPRQGLLGRLSGGRTCKSANVTSPRIPTAAERYVNLMLLQMFEDAPATRVLKRSEPLPVLTFRTETAEPPALEDVLNDLKGKCGITRKRRSGPADGTIHIGVQRVPCKVLCRFDESSEVCCRLELERMTEEELRAAEQKQ